MSKNKLIIICIIIFCGMFIYIQNNSLVITELDTTSDQIPESFNGYKIVHLSDLHGKYFGENQSKIISKIKNISPDLIVFTGDLVDSRRYNEEPGLLLLEELSHITDVYFVSGNHEQRNNYEELKVAIQGTGVRVLDFDSTTIERDNTKLTLLGIEDQADTHSQEDVLEQLSILYNSDAQRNDHHYSILLSHRPDYFESYQEHNIDLVFSGHAHGGQFRLPFLGGVVAPGQGLNPEYDSGAFVKDDTTMIVNRGLGNSIIPIRIFNRPEIVVVTLYTSKE